MKYGWKKILYLFRGLPGSGKSTAALKKMQGDRSRVVENDDFWLKDGKYEYDASMTHIAGWWCWSEAFRRLRIHDEVAVANVFCKKEIMWGFVEEALKHEIKVVITDLSSSVDPEIAFARNVHEVPRETFQGMQRGYERFTQREIDFLSKKGTVEFIGVVPKKERFFVRKSVERDLKHQ